MQLDEQCAASVSRRRIAAMRLLPLVLILAAASHSQVLPNNIKKSATPRYKQTPRIYNSVFSRNNRNKSSQIKHEYTSPSLLSNTQLSPVSLNSENKHITPENKSIIRNLNRSVTKTPDVNVRSVREIVYNSGNTNSNVQITPNINASKESLTETDDDVFNKQSGDVFLSMLETVGGVLGDSLSLWNYSVGFTDGKSLSEAFQVLEDGLALMEGARNASVRFALWPGVAVEMEPGLNGSVSFVIKSDDTQTHARGISLRKRFTRIFPYLLVPPLIMSAILPFVLPAMKLMAVAAGVLNQVALVGAVLTIMRNHAFSDTPKKKVIYLNEGYKNERPLEDHGVENSIESDIHLESDLKNYEEIHHGSHPYGKGSSGFDRLDGLEFAGSDDNEFQGRVTSHLEPVY